jgi:hypothetical protein
MESGFARWAVCLFLVLGPYIILGRSLFEHRHLAKRTYQYAE